MHRDIKLDNVLVKLKSATDPTAARRISDFEFKLGDLGLAKTLKSEQQLQGTLCGTPLYMAPEVISNQQYNQKADVWSLGTLLFQMLTGEYPFFGKDLEELKENVKQGVYRIPKDIQISFECLDFLNSCLKFESSQRKSWDELLQHPFLLTKSKLETESQQTLKIERKFLQTLQLDTKSSVNFYEAYSKCLISKIEKRIEKKMISLPKVEVKTEIRASWDE
jgi:serine/threonine protein kinase